MRVVLFLAGLLAVAASAAQPEVRRISTAAGDTVVATTYAPSASTSANATPVILVPGLLGASYTFRKLAPELTNDGHRVVIIEPLGMGASARPKSADYSLEAQATRLGQALDSLGISNATFVCHSVGASICMRLSLQRPSLARGIISLNGGPDETAATGGLKSALHFAPLLKLFGAQRIIKGKVKNGLKDTSVNPAWVTDSVLNAYTKPFANFNAVLDAFRGMVNSKERLPLRPRLSEITVPVTVMVGSGKAGAGIVDADLQVLAHAIPHLRIDSIATAGQYIQEENPAAIVLAVRLQQSIH